MSKTSLSRFWKIKKIIEYAHFRALFCVCSRELLRTRYVNKQKDAHIFKSPDIWHNLSQTYPISIMAAAVVISNISQNEHHILSGCLPTLLCSCPGRKKIL